MIALSKGQFLSDVMDEIPSDCIFSKRIPGCGATTLELDTDRHSIIIVPNVPVIRSKCEKYPDLLGVHERVQPSTICDCLTGHTLHKIMTTPESFGKVKTACERSGTNIYNHFFLLMDECHQLITDMDYREDIAIPMDDFFRFKHKALVSATPIEFSDPRFRENGFRIEEINASFDYRQEITAIHTYNIHKAIEDYLSRHTEGTVCFFVNSVVMAYSIMADFKIMDDASIYCAPKSRNKLRNEYKFANAYDEWSADTMKRYNFFTGRFFTAFDLEVDFLPDLVMLSDPHTADYTILDIETDCIQICGRFRNGIRSATHIYRIKPDIIVKERQQVEMELFAHEHVFNTIQTLYNNADSKELRYAFDSALDTLPFRKFLYPDFTKNWFAIDNEINSILVTNKYQNNELLKQWYTDCHFFNPTFVEIAYNENDEKLKLIRSARSVKEKRRQMVRLLSEFEEPVSEYAFDFINEIRKIDPFIVEAFQELGKERIEELKFSEKKIREEMILRQRKGNKTIRLVKNTFKVGNKYSNEKIINELARIFELLNIHPEKEIKASIITDYYQAVPCWVGKGRGYHLIKEII